MAGKKENIKALFSNTRSRVIILFTVMLLLITVIIGFIKFGSSTASHDASGSLAQSPGGIQSIPGAQDQTAQYAALQETQNIEQAQKARQTGDSSIPTIIRTQAFGEGVDIIGMKEGEGGVGFTALAREDSGGAQKSLWVQSLKEGDCNKSSLEKALSLGASLGDLREACSCKQLKEHGYKLTELEPVCTCGDLKSAGFDIVQMKEAGFTAGRLRLCGFVACDEKGVGFSAQEMKDAGFSDGELKGAGFSEQAIALTGGVPEGMNIDDIKRAGCDVEALKRLRASGVTASAIRRITGCSVTQLNVAGFSAENLKNAGFSAADLKQAGFNAADLKQAGLGARELLNAGFSGDDLANAGFASTQIKAAQAVLPYGLAPEDIKKAGCSSEAIKRQRLAGVSAAIIRKYAECDLSSLKQGGFSTNDLVGAGFRPTEINALTQPAPGDQMIRAAGSDPEKLKALLAMGVTAKRIRDLNGSRADVLKQAGFSAADLKAAGFNAADLKQAGFSANDLLKAGFTSDELAKAGFTAAQIKDAEEVLPKGMTLADIKSVGCDPNKLKELLAKGVTAKRIHDLNGCDASTLKQAGFGAADLRGAGFNATDLKQAAFGARELLNAGFTGDEVSKAGFTATQLKDAEEVLPKGFIPADIKKAGCSPEAIKSQRLAGMSAASIRKHAGCDVKALNQGGFTAKDLLNAGFQATDINSLLPSEPGSMDDQPIREAGCDPEKLKQLLAKGATAKRIHDLNGCGVDTLKKAGFDVKSLANAGFTPAQLLTAGFSPEQLISAGLSPTAIIAAGRIADCSPSSLKAARALGVTSATIKQTLGCASKALKEAGFSAADLKNAGFTAAELNNAGFGTAELKNAGYSAKDLRAAGFTAQQLGAAGFSPGQLKDAGFNALDLKNAGLSAAQLKAAGFDVNALKEAGLGVDALRKAGISVKNLKDAGFTADQLKQAGVSDQELTDAGFSSATGLGSITPLPGVSSVVTTIPSFAGSGAQSSTVAQEAANAKQLANIRAQQNNQMAAQRYQQKIQQQTSVMLSAANQALQGWKLSPEQTYIASSIKEEVATQAGERGIATGLQGAEVSGAVVKASGPSLVKTGDVLFAVIDTSVNSDEPGPILATIVSGKLKGSRLIGSFNLPSNSDEMVITFNTLSIPGADKTVSVKAFAIDPDTARTALSSQSDHHYLMRYGSLFAATFLEGFGNAFQSADTTITVGGAGSTTNTTVQNGINRSLLENAVIGLATLGKAWGQVAAQQMSRPTTVEVFAGTGVGVLFTQDLKLT